MTTDDSKSLALFGQQTIRRVWHTDAWYYSIVDVIAVLTESSNPRNYWNMLKARAKSEGFDTAMADIVPLKLKSADNRFRLTETANRATLLRIIQSIPSPRAEPFRLWLAQVGDERLEEIENPEAAIERIRELYRARGHNEAWIEARIRIDLARNELTDEA
ncbi:MAG: BRO family protein [Roseiflexaceae bacterium]